MLGVTDADLHTQDTQVGYILLEKVFCCGSHEQSKLMNTLNKKNSIWWTAQGLRLRVGGEVGHRG